MPKKRRRKNNIGRRLLILALGLCVLIGGPIVFYQSQLRAVGDGSRNVEFDIEKGATFNDVVDDLKEENLIRSKTVTKLYARLTNHSSYYAGQFHLNDGMSTPQILEHIEQVENAGKNQVKLTVPEGTWAKDIAAKISKVCPKLKTKD
ncbi:MAG: endolytic transglycosylase MltG, partial [Erysipelotrichaceae bacterium]|nr:endolytic transglycosylase MltG [Erysipelotrichaceae bacterium]